MTAKRYIFFSILALIGGAVALGLIVLRSAESPGPEKSAEPSRPLTLKPSQTTLAHLYFADKEGHFLIAEERILKHPENPAFFARSIVEALIQGPQKGLIRTIPADTRVRAIYVTREGVCYVDLTADIADQHPGGIQSELFSVYSIVNSVVLNVPEVEAVKILISGDESATLAGHIDLQVPVKANMLLIR
ncbi:MAG: GerMN domain-containing protein [Desulfobacterales bacterium]|jgi:spore germination protein GerM